MSEVVDFGRVIRRAALLERLRQAQPRIVALVAPAGFGKSTLVRQFIEELDGAAICDCAGLYSDVDFARRIVATLADAEPERSAMLSQRQLLLGDDSATTAERVAIALAAWRDKADSTIFVFENAERVLDGPGMREVFTRLLAERPESRTVIICSRVGLRIHLTRFAAPHQIVTLRADDLSFERRDLDELFSPVLNAPTLDRIFTASLGWPIATFLLARFAIEGRLDALLERLGDVAFEELHDYLADEVLATLPHDLIEALFAAASMPNATASDLSIVTGTGDAAALLDEFGRASPFVRRSANGEYVVHPLLAGTLMRNKAELRTALLATSAAAYERSGDFLRAAELHLAIPDQEAAAAALEEVPVGNDRAPSMRYSRLLSSLERDLVRRHPTLWSCNALFQMFSTDCRQLLNDTHYVWNALPPSTPLHKRYYVFATRVLLLSYLGRFEEALTFIEQVAPDGNAPPNSAERGYKLYLRGTIFARMGRTDEAERDLLLTLPFAQRMDAMASAVNMLLGTDVDRLRGNAAGERDRLALSLEFARRSELINVVAFRLAEAALGSWLTGDDEGFRSSSEELQTIVDGYGIRGFAFYAACVRGDVATPRDADLPRWVLCGHLIAASTASDRAKGLQHAAAAEELGASYPNPFLQTLAAVAVAELSPEDNRSKHYERAYALAQKTGAPAVADAVAAAREGKTSGMLSPLVRRFGAKGEEALPPIEISVISGSVLLSGKEVHLGDREMALVVALSLRPHPVSQSQLLEMLWPDSDEQAATNALYACLHRLRNRLGEERVVRSVSGLRLSDEARVDLWKIDRRVTNFRSREISDEDEYAQVMLVYQALRNDRPARYLAWEWFVPVERYLSELRCDLGLRLGRYSVRANRHEEALALTREMIAHDPCDEGAREIAISAYLALGNRSAALQHYRQYKSVLMEELHCVPSPSISALVGVQGETETRKGAVRVTERPISRR
jgi:DNA-binding SARP family transcriptional activator